MLDRDIYLMNIEKAKRRIESLYNETGGACYLSFSGGKDSTIVLSLIKELGLNIPAVFSNTGLEMDAIVDFVKWVKENYYSNIIEVKPRISYAQVIKSGKPFRSKMKSTAIKYFQKNPNGKTARSLYDDNHTTSHKLKLANKDFHIIHNDFAIKINDNCCEEMKKQPFKEYVLTTGALGCLTGMRAFEGGQRQFSYDRKLRSGQNVCTNIQKDGFIQKSPIIEWTDEMCEMYISENNIPLSRAYTEYKMKRTGCYLCPYDTDLASRLEILHKYEPNKYKAALYFMKDIYIAQGVKLDFDENYMNEYNKMWIKYNEMRNQMLSIWRPNCRKPKVR